MDITFSDNKIPNFQKLAAYGFKEYGDQYIFKTNIVGGQLLTTIAIDKDGNVSTETVDSASGEVYSLHLVEGVTGAFVGAVREDLRRVLDDIAAKCYEGGTLKSEATQAVLNFAKEKYGDELEFLWEGFPKDAVLRRKDSGKWYALFVELKRCKLGLDGDGDVNIAVMRALPDSASSLPDGKRFLPAYHMNKKNWITAVLDGDADIRKICELLAVSYDLAKT